MYTDHVFKVCASSEYVIIKKKNMLGALTKWAYSKGKKVDIKWGNSCAEIKAKKLKCEGENTGIQKKKAALPISYVKRAAAEEAELELLPANGGWIFNDPNQDAVITRGTDCHAGALCAEHPGICRLVLFMVPVPQVWHYIWFRSRGGEVRVWQEAAQTRQPVGERRISAVGVCRQDEEMW